MQWRALLRRILRRRKRGEIDPDEIFIDATNLPQFDENQFEGRIERPFAKRTFFYFGLIVLLIVFLFTGRIFLLQISKGSVYAEISENNRLNHSLIFSNRGVIYDRNGIQLAWNEKKEEKDFGERIYQVTGGFAHLLGYVGYPLKDSNGFYYQEDYLGKSGVERELNEELSGTNGLKIVETDALGTVHSESVIRHPQDGDDVYLTIDSRVSAELYRLIQERSEESGFSGGAGVIMDIQSGEIIALSSFPEYNPNDLTAGGTEALQGYLGDIRKPFLNRVISGLYTPGSIVKPFIAIGALEEGIITPEKEILSTGALRLPNPYFPDQESVFRDWKAHGLVNMREAIAVSSDEYFYQIGGGYKDQPGLGIENIDKYMRLFGFGSSTNILFAGEAEGTIPTPAWKAETFGDDVWRVGDTYHTAIGQYGFQVTPLQVVRATAALANGGVLVTPILEHNKKADVHYLSLDPEHVKVAREGMRLSVTTGTAKGLLMPDVMVAAKTGTAELGTEKAFVNSWVIGFFPYEHPRYAFAIIMEHGPVENTIGGLYVMRRLLEWMSSNAPSYVRE
ncbi:MAG TPA: penicillin-binding transpeptidase domain-containing protein [Candidatus Paceibacterota bacterium]